MQAFPKVSIEYNEESRMIFFVSNGLLVIGRAQDKIGWLFSQNVIE